MSHGRVANSNLDNKHREDGGQRPHLRVVQAFPEGKAGTVMALGVDVGQDSYKERSRLLLRNQLPTAGLTELWEEKRGETVTADSGSEGKRGDGRQNSEVELQCVPTWATY